MNIKRKNLRVLLIIVCIVFFSSCFDSSNIKKFHEAALNCTAENSKISYNGGATWFDFSKQDESIRNYYLNHLCEISDSLLEMDLKKVNKEDFNGTDVLKIIIESNGIKYELHLKNIYPNTGTLKVTVNNQEEYYVLDAAFNKAISDIIFYSDNYPFNHISLLDFLIKDNS